MPAYANGTVYGKYIKIKSGTAGVKKCSDYIKDPEKIQPLPKNNQPKTRKTYQAENAIHYIQNDPKIINPSKKLIADENKNSTLYDMLFYMKSRLEKLPNIEEQGFQTTKQLNPDEYRFIYDLQSLYPNRLNIHSMAPEDIHYLIVKLKAEGFFEKEMTKALENEKKEKRNQNEQNNIERY